MQGYALNNGYRIYLDILTGENLQSIQLANMNLIYWSVGSLDEEGWAKGGGGWKSLLKVHFITEYMIIWCKIQVILNPLLEQTYLKRAYSMSLSTFINLLIGTI